VGLNAVDLVRILVACPSLLAVLGVVVGAVAAASDTDTLLLFFFMPTVWSSTSYSLNLPFTLAIQRRRHRFRTSLLVPIRLFAHNYGDR
jgi:hypothetical protein